MAAGTKKRVTKTRVRALLSHHGELRPQGVRHWRGSFPLPQDLVAFYEGVGPVDISIPSYGNPFFLPSLKKLWSYQVGYRWSTLDGPAHRGWSDDWLVVADEGEAAFIFNRPDGAILHALHGAGKWAPRFLFPDILSMAGSLAMLGDVVCRAGESLTDEACLIRPRHLQAALRGLGDLLGTRSAATRVARTLGFME